MSEMRENPASLPTHGKLANEPFRSASGLQIEASYTSVDLDARGFNELRDLGRPGVMPYTRGIDSALYRSQPWIMGQYSGYASAEETNRRFKQLLAGGQSGFSVALDLPTQLGLDSDHPLAAGEVGRVGVPINSVQDVRLLLDGIDLSKVRQIRTSANSIGPIIAAMFVVAGRSQGVEPPQFRMMLQNDSLKEYIARGTYIFPPAQGLRLSVDLIEYCAANLPHWEPIEFCGYHVRDAGCDAIAEVAIALSNGMAYMDAAIARGLDIDAFAPSLVMFLSSGLDIFEEVAKLRAARRLWARTLDTRYRAAKAESKRLSIFCYTLGGALAAQQPLNNVVRVAYEALAAALGGVQTLATSSFDEALGLPTDFAAVLALRTQQILAFETGITRTTDPLGGSYYLESLTCDIEARIADVVDQISALGGAVAAIESGFYQRLIDDGAYSLQLAIEDGSAIKVGVNRFTEAPQFDLPRASTHSIEPEAERRQIERTIDVRATRDRGAWERAMAGVENDARTGKNTMESIIAAVAANATLGEICTVLRACWGEHRQAGSAG